jgi:membrane protein
MTIAGMGPTDFAKKTFHEFSKDDVSGLAAELSYRFFLALFPFLIFLAALGGFIASALGVADPTSSVMNAIGDALPSDARSVLETQVRGVLNSHNAGLLSFGIIGAIWASSSATKTMIKAMNRAYDVEESRKFWQTTLLALGMTLAGTLGILGAIVLYAFTTGWAGTIAGWFNAGSEVQTAILVLRWPLIIALILTAVGIIYAVAPNRDVGFRWVSLGAVVFAVIWSLATVGFGAYVTHFGSYNKTYGTLGGVVILMTWLYLTNYALLAGAEINAIFDAAHARQSGDDTTGSSGVPQQQELRPPAERRTNGQLVGASDHRHERAAPSLAKRAAILLGAAAVAAVGAYASQRAAPD